MRLQPILLLTALALIWGSSFILMKEGLKAFTPVQMAAFRIFVSGFVFWPVVWMHLRVIKRTDLKWAVLVGFVGNGIPAFLFAIAQTRVNSSMAGVLNALTPIFTLLISFAIARFVLQLSKIAGVLTGFCGAILLILAKSEGQIQGASGFTILIVGATMLYGLNINLIKLKLSAYRPVVIASVPLFVVSVLCLIIFLSNDGAEVIFSRDNQDRRSAVAIAVLAIMGTSVGLVLFNRLIQLTGPVFASSVTYLIPIVALFLGWMDGEQTGLIQLSGMALILAGIYLINLKKKQAS